MSTQVINIRHAPDGWKSNPEYVYIGRAGKGELGYYGNPFKLVAGEPKGSTLELFKQWVIGRMAIDEEYRRRVIELKGKTLVCFCSPSPCHGDILAEIADSI